MELDFSFMQHALPFLLKALPGNAFHYCPGTAAFHGTGIPYG